MTRTRLWFAMMLFAVAILAACNKQNPQAQQGPGAMPVKVETVRLQTVPDSTEFVATVRSRDASVLQPQVEGQITKIYVRAGQHVTAGEPLVEIDLQKQAATVRTQEANERSKTAQLELNRLQLERMKKLWADGVISKQELDQAQTAYDSSVADVEALKASVNEQKQQLRYYTVSAPQAGIVGDIPVRVGDHVSTTTMLTTVDSGRGLEAYISIPAERASQVHVGTQVTLIAEDGSKYPTTLSFISPAMDQQNQLLLTKAPVPDNGKFRNNQVIHVRVIWRDIQAPLVPVLAVSRQAGEIFVFIAGKKDGHDVAMQKQIVTSDTIGNDYVVKSGVQPGDKLIVSSVNMMADGMPIMPMEGNGGPGGAAGDAQGAGKQ